MPENLPQIEELNPEGRHWNYRLMRRVYPDGAVEFGIYEVYYKDGQPDLWGINTAEVFGETPESIKECLEKFSKALEEPILEWNTQNDQIQGEVDYEDNSKWAVWPTNQKLYRMK